MENVSYEKSMSSTTEKNPNLTHKDIEALKQDIQKTKEILQMTADAIMKPVLTKLLEDQTQHLIELESKSRNTPLEKVISGKNLKSLRKKDPE